MYVTTQFQAAAQADMLALMAANPLGALVRAGTAGLEADHIPFELVPPSDAAPYGLLRAHVARAKLIRRRTPTRGDRHGTPQPHPQTERR